MSAKLTERAMLVSYHETRWNARKYDRKISDEVAKAHNASEAVGRYNKNLLPVDAPSYKAVHQVYNAARTCHYEQTLPWQDEGPRILPATNFLDYGQRMRGHFKAIDLAVADFLHDYPRLQANAQATLNSLYNPADYPTVEELRSKFSHDMRVLPMPDASDFRVTLADDDVQEIRENIQRDVDASVADAMRDLYTRLHTAVAHMANKLTDTDAVFRDSLVMNLRELCDLLPRLNLTGDANLDAMRARIEDELASWEPEDLRKSKPLRSEIARKAEQIQSDLAAFMGV
jgi:hypothetical protein